MLKRTPVIILLLSLLSFSLVIATPISILSVNLASHDSINEILFYEYLPDTPSEVESLYLNIDYGNIIIDYIDPPVNYFAKIEVNIEMGGAGLSGKEYDEYFNIIEGDSASSPINFSMRLLPSITESEIESLIKDVSVVVTLQKGIAFDIFASVVNGDVSIEVPFKVKINKMHFNLTTGNIFYDLNRCIIGGNISGITNNGKIVLVSENAEYTQNSVWLLYSSRISIDIIQHNDLGANVTGSITTVEDVSTRFFYNDTVHEVGAKFTLYDYNYVSFPNGTDVNFDYDILGAKECSYTSTDFPTNNNYIFSLYLRGMLCRDFYNF